MNTSTEAPPRGRIVDYKACRTCHHVYPIDAPHTCPGPDRTELTEEAAEGMLIGYLVVGIVCGLVGFVLGWGLT